MNDKCTQTYEEWANTLPDKPRRVALSHPGDRIYRLSTTNHRVRIISYANDGTMTVAVTADLNLLNMERAVFGIHPYQLTECDPPSPDELVGITMTEDEQLKRVNALRLSNGVRPVESLDELRMGNTLQ